MRNSLATRLKYIWQTSAPYQLWLKLKRRAVRPGTKSVREAGGLKLSLPQWRLRGSKYVIGGFIFAILSLLILVIGTKYLNLRWEPYSPATHPQVTLGNKYFNVLIATTIRNSDYSYVTSVQVLSVSRDQYPNRLIGLNPDFSSAAVDGVNQVRLRNIMAAAKAQSKPEMESLIKAVELMLAVKLDRYIVMDQANISQFYTAFGFNPTVQETGDGYTKGDWLSPEALPGYLFADYYDTDARPMRQMRMGLASFTYLANLVPTIQYLFNLPLVAKLVNTDMNTNEWLLMLTGFRNQPNWQSTVLKISDTLAVDNGLEKLYQPQVINVDRQIQDNFALLEVIKEQARVEVYNGTSRSGLARKYQRFIENQGGKVIKTGNNPEVSSSSVLYVGDREAKFPQTVELIKDTLRGDVVISESEYPFASASDLVLVLGGELE